MNTGYAINPARDFSPRLFTLMVYGTETFTANDYWFYVPLIFPHIGAIIGAFAYEIFIAWHYEYDENK